MALHVVRQYFGFLIDWILTMFALDGVEKFQQEYAFTSWAGSALFSRIVLTANFEHTLSSCSKWSR